MTETAKRLTPKPEILRELFLRSGNLCAFPSCDRLILSPTGAFIGQLCHIEAALDGGERFNPNMSNEERRSAPNLFLMCYEHHIETNNVAEYPVERLRQIKKDHERKFSDPVRAILSTLRDYTKSHELTRAANLARFRRILGWPRMSDQDLEASLNEINGFIEKFSRVPIEIRRFVGEVAMRIERIKDLPAVDTTGHFCPSIRLSDLRGAFRIDESKLWEIVKDVESYGLGYMTPVRDTEYDREHPALRLRAIDGGWCFWEALAEFAQKTNEPMTAFSEDMDFTRLDDE